MENEESIARIAGTLNWAPASSLPRLLAQPETLVLVVIPVYRDAEGLARTLSSFAQFGAACPAICVVNDGRSEEVFAVTREFNVRHIFGDGRGSYAARNLGVLRNAAQWYHFIDADVTIDAGWLKWVDDAVERKLDYVGGGIQPSKQVGVTSLYMELFEFPTTVFSVRDKFAPTANLLVSRKVFERIGLFDERLRSGGDLEFGRRADAAGVTIGHCAAMKVNHPLRTFSQYRRKIARQAVGHDQLGILSPGLFPEYTPSRLPRIVLGSFFGGASAFRKALAASELREKGGGRREICGLFCLYKMLRIVYAWERVRAYVSRRYYAAFPATAPRP